MDYFRNVDSAEGLLDIVTPVGVKTVLSNTGTVDYSLYGAYEVFHAEASVNPALTTITLKPGDNITFTNQSNGAFGVSLHADAALGGKYEVTQYSATGIVNFHANGTNNAEGLLDIDTPVEIKTVLSNTGTVDYSLYGAYEVFKVSSSTTTVPVTSVTLNVSSATVAIDGKQQLTAVVSPINATNQNLKWSSSDPTKAIVDAYGLITGISAGTAIITVTTDDGGKNAICNVTIPSANGGVVDKVKPVITLLGLNEVMIQVPMEH